jgi:hypothetical protein
MSEKTIYIFAGGVGSSILGYAPGLFGIGIFSFWGILGSTIGGLLGIFLAYRWMH